MKTMEEAIRAKTASEEELLKRPGVTGVDVGEGVGGRPIIRIYVVDRTKAVAEGTLPNEINGVPVEIVERRFHIH